MENGMENNPGHESAPTLMHRLKGHAQMERKMKRSTRSIVLGSAFIGGGTMLATLAGAPIQQQIGSCSREDRVESDLRINACTAVIQSGRLTGANQALALHHRANAYYSGKDYERAIADYNEAIRLDPTDANSFIDRAIAYRAKGDLDRAIADYNEAIRLAPKTALAYANRAIAFPVKGDLDRAIMDYGEAIRLDPKKGRVFANRGAAYVARRDFDLAIADYTEAIL